MKQLLTASFLVALTLRAPEAAPLPIETAEGDLGRAVPSECFLYLRLSTSPEADFVRSRLRDVGQALGGSGFFGEYVRVLEQGVAEDRRPSFREDAAYWRKILDRISWWDLFHREFVMAAREGATGRVEWMLLFRVGSEQRGQILRHLRNVLYALSVVEGEYELEVRNRDDAPTTVLYNLLEPGDELCAAGQADVVVLATSTSLARRSLQLLGRRGSGLGLADGPRLEGARRDLGLAPRRDGEASAVLELLLEPGAVLESLPALDVLRSLHLFATIEARRIECDFRIRLKDARGLPLGRALSDRPPARDMLDGVPLGVDGFTVTSGSDPADLYDFWGAMCEAFVGGEVIGALEEWQAEHGFHLRDDFLRHLTGRRTVLELAAPEAEKASEPHSTGGTVHLLELARDPAARTAAARFLEVVAKLGRDGGLTVREEDIAGGAGRLVVIELPPIFGLNVAAGLLGDRVVFCTAEETVRRFADLSSKSAPAIRSDPDFSKLWKDSEPTGGQVETVVYERCGSTLETLGTILRLGGALGRIVPEKDPKGLFMFRPLLVALPRLGGTLRSLRFLDRVFGYTTRAGDTLRGHRTIFLRSTGRW